MSLAESYAVPTWVTDVELTQPIETLEVPTSPAEAYRQVRVMARLDRAPVGYVTFETGAGSTVEASDVASGIWLSLESEVRSAAERLGIDTSNGLDESGFSYEHPARPEPRPMISVILCTRNRAQGACDTLSDLLAMDYSPFEIIVVDNAPSDDATKDAIASRFSDERIRYVREDAPGLSFARNRGLSEASGTIVAFTDDDVHVDKWWLAGILEGFERGPNVGCVTGPVFSARLDNAIQHYFDRRTGWSSLMTPRMFDMRSHRDESVLYPFAPGLFGTGANFSFDTTTIKSAGGFDTALGAGSFAGGGEDLDAFLKVLLAGKIIVQEPSAIVWHVHRSSVGQLSEQMFYYGAGLAAFIWKYLTNPRTAPTVLRRLPAGFVRLAGISQRSAGDTGGEELPRSVLFRELLGMICGPFLYERGRARTKRHMRQSMKSEPLVTR